MKQYALSQVFGDDKIQSASQVNRPHFFLENDIIIIISVYIKYYWEFLIFYLFKI